MRLLCSARGNHVDGVQATIKLNRRTSEVLIVVYQNITGDLKHEVEQVNCDEPESCVVLFFSNSKLRPLGAFPILLVLGTHEGLTLCCSLALFLCKMGAGDCWTALP